MAVGGGLGGLVAGTIATVGQAAREYSADRAARMGAGLAYYSLFALAPLLFLAISLAGLIIGTETAQGELEARLSNAFGPEIAAVVSDMVVAEVASPALTSTLPVVSLLVLLFGASVLFGAWRDALNLIFDVPWRRGLEASVRRRLFALALVLVFGAAVFTMVLAQSIVRAIDVRIGLGIVENGLEVALVAVPYLFGAGALALVYKYSPDHKLAWSDVLAGTVPTVIGLGVGTWLYGLYLGGVGRVTAASVAGAVFLLLAWIYYSAQILLFGAELINVRSRLRGSSGIPVSVSRARRGPD